MVLFYTVPESHNSNFLYVLHTAYRYLHRFLKQCPILTHVSFNFRAFSAVSLIPETTHSYLIWFSFSNTHFVWKIHVSKGRQVYNLLDRAVTIFLLSFWIQMFPNIINNYQILCFFLQLIIKKIPASFESFLQFVEVSFSII